MDTVKKLTNWDQVDNAIKDIADATSRRDILEGEMNQKMLDVQKEYTDTLDGLNKEITANNSLVNDFAEKHIKELPKVLNYGEVTVQNTAGSIQFMANHDEKKVIEKIRDKFKKLATQYINVKETLSKTALKKLDVKTLKSLGLQLVSNKSININFFKSESPEK